MDLGLKDKVVIITGATGGIGRIMLEAFAAEGAIAICASRNVAVGREIAEAANKKGFPGKIIAIACDITDRDSVNKMVEEVHKSAGIVSVLVNNAGGASSAGDFSDLTDEARLSDVALNITGATFCIQALAADLAETHGSIVNISSSAAYNGTPGFVHYGAVKGYMNALTRALAVEWGPKGIRVNNVVPGLTVPHSSDATSPSSFWNRFGDVFGTPEGLQAGLEADALPFMSEFALKRLGRPEDITNAVVFLSSQAASYITGQTLHVSGGSVM